MREVDNFCYHVKDKEKVEDCVSFVEEDFIGRVKEELDRIIKITQKDKSFEPNVPTFLKRMMPKVGDGNYKSLS